MMGDWRTIILSCCLLVTVGLAEAAPNASQGQYNAGTRLRQDLEALRQQRIAEELKKEQQQRQDGNVIEDNVVKDKEPISQDTVFFCREIIVSESEILTKAELDAIITPFQNKEITIKDLYGICEQINKLYQEKGYPTAQAFIPQQKITRGVVKIKLLEAKSGQIIVEGNTHTRKSYILDRIPLKEQRILNIKSLAERLRWFNATNDIQLRLELKPGKELLTTDYYLTAYEPQQVTGSIFFDNAGSEDSGRERYGLSYGIASVSGNRDPLMITGVFSGGTQSGGVFYSTPVNRRGSKLAFNYSKNWTKITDSAMEDLDIKGNSEMMSLTFTHPFVADKAQKTEGFVELRRQTSYTELLDFPFRDNTLFAGSLGIAVSNFGNNWASYQRHALTNGKMEGLYFDQSYQKYDLYLLYQHAYGKNHLLTVKGGAQYSFTDDLTSEEMFFIGGAYNVRGYKENTMGGDHGYWISVEYGLPDGLTKNGQWVFFADGGKVMGESSPLQDTSLASIGFGYKNNLNSKTYFSTYFAVPLIKEYGYEEKADNFRVHLSFNQLF